MTWYLYRLGGIELASEFELALPLSASGLFPTGPPAVHIRRGVVAALAKPVLKRLLIEVTPDDYVLEIPGIARYRATGGEEVVVQVTPGAPERAVLTYLTNYALAALFSQRGLLVLHATVLAIDGCAVLLAGPSASGKSTLGAFLAARGALVLCDDLCIIDTEAATAMVQPCSNRLSLWADCLERLGPATAEPQQPIAALQKFSVQLSAAAERPVPLRYVLTLCEARFPQPSLQLATLRPLEALATFASGACLSTLVEGMNRQHVHLGQCRNALRDAQCLKLIRRWGLAEMPAVASAIELFVRGTRGPAAAARQPGSADPMLGDDPPTRVCSENVR